jgi:enterochelin esterase-like enzyme
MVIPSTLVAHYAASFQPGDFTNALSESPSATWVPEENEMYNNASYWSADEGGFFKAVMQYNLP